LLRAHVGLSGEGGDALLDLLRRGGDAEAFRRLPLQAFVDQRLAGLGHDLGRGVQERQEAAALLDLVIRDDVVIHAHGDGEGALRMGLRRGGRQDGGGKGRGEDEAAGGAGRDRGEGAGSCHGVLIGFCRVACKCLPWGHRRSAAIVRAQ
jgi:hypothetical protein